MKIKLEWLTAAFTGVIAVTGICALRYAEGQIRQARDEALVQHLIALDKEYNSEPLKTYRKVCAQKRLAGEEEPDEEVELVNFFETVALLANKGELKDEDVWETFSPVIFPLYADARDNIEQDRKEDHADYQNLVLLVPRLEAIDEAHNGSGTSPSKDAIHLFWESEAQLGVTRHRQTNAK